MTHAGDPNSYARPDQVTTKHLHLELVANFTKKVLEGHVILTLVRMDPAADSVLLDASKLAVVGVREEDTGTDLDWTLDSPSINGEKLRVALPPGKKVRLHFHLPLYMYIYMYMHMNMPFYMGYYKLLENLALCQCVQRNLVIRNFTGGGE